MTDRAEIVHQNFISRVAGADFPDTKEIILADIGITNEKLVEVFETQVLSRQLDRISRKLQARGEGFYTIGSSGHEGVAAVAEALKVDDMAFLHYRDASFLIQRSKKEVGQTPLWDMLLSFVASSDDPISAGRHKVLGSKSLYIPPQTSTIASHLPKAVGTAHGIQLADHLKLSKAYLAKDSIVFCSFGDASVNHSTAQGALNAAAWSSFKSIPTPLMFLCEDNGIGISTPTPTNWIEETYKHKPGLKYMTCDGLNVLDTYKVSKAATEYVRNNRKPVFLHMKCVRLYGHAGADVQTAYMSQAKINLAESQDPLLHTASLLIKNNILSVAQVLEIYNTTGQRVERSAEKVIDRPKLKTSEEVQKSLIPPKRCDLPNNELISDRERQASFGHEFKSLGQPQHMARLINWTLSDLMLSDDHIVLAGEDIGPKGGVYNVTAKLYDRFGPQRVINTILDEQTILGLAIGLAHNNILPIPEIQFLAYLHNAEDQIRGEAATLSFFSDGQYTNPMVVRIAGLSYQKGFGGHFHNDNSIAVLRDIPGVIIACPSNGSDAVEMLRECVRLAREEQRVVVFLEPIALYMTRDLHEEKDGLWTFQYKPPHSAKPIKFGEISVYGKGSDLCVLTYGNGYYLSRQAEDILKKNHKIRIRVVDLRWLAPLNEEAILKAVKPCQNILIVDECRKTGSLSEAIMALLNERTEGKKIRRLTADDCFIPLGRAYNTPLPSRDKIVENVLHILRELSP